MFKDPPPTMSARRNGDCSPHEAQKHIGASSEDIARPVWSGVYTTGG